MSCSIQQNETDALLLHSLKKGYVMLKIILWEITSFEALYLYPKYKSCKFRNP